MRARLAVLLLLPLLAACESTEPASPLKGVWNGRLYREAMSVTLDERDGVVTGSSDWGPHHMPLTAGTFAHPRVDLFMRHPEYDRMELSLEMVGDTALFGVARFGGSIQFVLLKRE